MEPGKFCLEQSEEADRLRVQNANQKAEDKIKRKRKILRAQRKHKGDKAQEKEGLTYAAGEFSS